jgi:hypothetical protein
MYATMAGPPKEVTPNLKKEIKIDSKEISGCSYLGDGNIVALPEVIFIYRAFIVTKKINNI